MSTGDPTKGIIRDAALKGVENTPRNHNPNRPKYPLFKSPQKNGHTLTYDEYYKWHYAKFGR